MNWEYITKHTSLHWLEEDLNKLGMERWELVACWIDRSQKDPFEYSPTKFVMKRAVEIPPMYKIDTQSGQVELIEPAPETPSPDIQPLVANWSDDDMPF